MTFTDAAKIMNVVSYLAMVEKIKPIRRVGNVLIVRESVVRAFKRKTPKKEG